MKLYTIGFNNSESEYDILFTTTNLKILNIFRNMVDNWFRKLSKQYSDYRNKYGHKKLTNDFLYTLGFNYEIQKFTDFLNEYCNVLYEDVKHYVCYWWSLSIREHIYIK